MVERFLLNRVYTKAAGTTIGGQYDLIVLTGPYEAHALLTFF
jgi:hypothetical protein